MKGKTRPVKDARGTMLSSSSAANRHPSSVGSVAEYVETNQQKAQQTATNDDNSRVRVVVRIRPLSAKEEKSNHKNILEGGERHIVAWDPTCLEQNAKADLAILDASCWSREFAFDRCLWSTDAKSNSYASQSDVFDEVGQPVLDWILGGYNCCVFAFGQTGAGKTWTMMGDIKSSDPSRYGLIPRICFSLFEALDELSTGEGLESVMFSHMEIYNENVRDLLAPPSSNNNGITNTTEYLRVREHPTRGVFVANLTTIRVTNFEDLMSLIAIGDKNRTVGATNINAHSSRSHAIVTLTVIQRSRSAPKHGLPTSALQQKVGRVHLVDLAGSERVYMTGAQGTRLREASNINRSLSVLGDVIKCLGDLKGGLGHGNGFSGGGPGGTKKAHVPYRNSTLTMVLKDSLGGNAHAVMLTAVSPSSFDYEETISTLKYADRAKRVRMRVEANVTSGLLATDASAVELVPLLQAEVRKLREMLAAQQQEQGLVLQQASRGGNLALPPRHNGVSGTEGSQSSGYGNGGGGGLGQPGGGGGVDEVEEMRERVRELEHQLAERERLIESLDIMRREREVERGLAEAERALDAAVAVREQRMRQGEGGGKGRNSGNRKEYNERSGVYYHIEEREMYTEEDDDEEEDGDDDVVYDYSPTATTATPSSRSNNNNNNSGMTHHHHHHHPPPPHSRRFSFDDRDDHSHSHGGLLPLGVNASVGDLRKSLVIPSSLSPVDYPSPTRNTRPPSLPLQPPPSSQSSSSSSGSNRNLPVVVLSNDAVDVTLPRVINLNQDPLFSECLVYYIPAGASTVAGSTEADADILLSGPDIAARHCIMRHDGALTEASTEGGGSHVYIQSAEPDALVFVNGDILTYGEERLLKHHDRVALGRFHLFRFEASGQGQGLEQGQGQGQMHGKGKASNKQDTHMDRTPSTGTTPQSGSMVVGKKGVTNTGGGLSSSSSASGVRRRRNSVTWEDEEMTGKSASTAALGQHANNANAMDTARNPGASILSSVHNTGTDTSSHEMAVVSTSTPSSTPSAPPPDWEFAQQELMMKNEALLMQIRRSADQPSLSTLIARNSNKAGSPPLLASAANDAITTTNNTAANKAGNGLSTTTNTESSVAPGSPSRHQSLVPPSLPTSPPFPSPRSSPKTNSGGSPRTSSSSPSTSSKEPLVSAGVNPFVNQLTAEAGLNPFADTNLPPLTAEGESFQDVATWQQQQQTVLQSSRGADGAPSGSPSSPRSKGLGKASNTNTHSRGSSNSTLPLPNGKEVSPSSVTSTTSTSTTSSHSSSSQPATQSSHRILLSRPKPSSSSSSVSLSTTLSTALSGNNNNNSRASASSVLSQQQENGQVDEQLVMSQWAEVERLAAPRGKDVHTNTTSNNTTNTTNNNNNNHHHSNNPFDSPVSGTQTQRTNASVGDGNDHSNWQVVVDVVDVRAHSGEGDGGGGSTGANGERSTKPPLTHPKPSSVEPTLPTPTSSSSTTRSSTTMKPTTTSSSSSTSNGASVYPRHSPSKHSATSTPTKPGHHTATNTMISSPSKNDRGVQAIQPVNNAPNGDAPASFEKEALALQEELAQMQKQLQERMERYSVLTAFRP